jgi:hypothetical protein
MLENEMAKIFEATIVAVACAGSSYRNMSRAFPPIGQVIASFFIVLELTYLLAVACPQ